MFCYQNWLSGRVVYSCPPCLAPPPHLECPPHIPEQLTWIMPAGIPPFLQSLPFISEALLDSFSVKPYRPALLKLLCAPGILLKCRSWFRRAGMELKTLHLYQALQCPDAAGLNDTLWGQAKDLMPCPVVIKLLPGSTDLSPPPPRANKVSTSLIQSYKL